MPVAYFPAVGESHEAQPHKTKHFLVSCLFSQVDGTRKGGTSLPAVDSE